MTRLASDIREADRPIYCSACFNSQAIRHVDFDAACDRGYANEEAVKVVMDDLIICENCVREGAEILGMQDNTLLTAEVQELRAKLATKDKLLAQQERYSSTMESLLQQRGQDVDHRKKPRKLEEVA